MSKTKKTLGEKILEEQERDAKSALSIIYEDGFIADFTTADNQNPFASFVSAAAPKELPNQPITDEQRKEKCLQIRENVKQCKPNNIEVNFVKGIHRFEGKNHELDNTVVKAVAWDVSTPVYLYLKKGDVLNSYVFIGDDARAFLVIIDEKGNENFIKLLEFHLFTICEGSSPGKEVGLLTSFVYLTGKIYSSYIIGMSLDPIKSLLLSEEFRKTISDMQKLEDSANE